jgi:hypothetical protein
MGNGDFVSDRHAYHLDAWSHISRFWSTEQIRSKTDVLVRAG